jgi:hypothetical protein
MANFMQRLDMFREILQKRVIPESHVDDSQIHPDDSFSDLAKEFLQIVLTLYGRKEQIPENVDEIGYTEFHLFIFSDRDYEHHLNASWEAFLMFENMKNGGSHLIEEYQERMNRILDDANRIFRPEHNYTNLMLHAFRMDYIADLLLRYEDAVSDVCKRARMYRRYKTKRDNRVSDDGRKPENLIDNFESRVLSDDVLGADLDIDDTDNYPSDGGVICVGRFSENFNMFKNSLMKVFKVSPTQEFFVNVNGHKRSYGTLGQPYALGQDDPLSDVHQPLRLFKNNQDEEDQLGGSRKRGSRKRGSRNRGSKKRRNSKKRTACRRRRLYKRRIN